MRRLLLVILFYTIFYAMLAIFRKFVSFETAVFFALAYLMAQDAIVEIIKDIKK